MGPQKVGCVDRIEFCSVSKMNKEHASKPAPVVRAGGSLEFTFPLVSKQTASVLQTAQSRERETHCPELLKYSESRYNE